MKPGVQLVGRSGLLPFERVVCFSQSIPLRSASVERLGAGTPTATGEGQTQTS